MKLSILNGSPRGKSSNSRVLLERFCEGFLQNSGNTSETIYLRSEKDPETLYSFISKSSYFLLAFPLYTDAMPAQVKGFIELLAPLKNEKQKPTMLFLVQSGFPESHHSRFIERYLEGLCSRLDIKYAGTMVRGGIEGIQVQPDWMTRKIFETITQLGYSFGETGKLDPALLESFSGSEHLKSSTRLLYRIGRRLGITNMYWNMQLKKNKAWEQRFNRPYSG